MLQTAASAWHDDDVAAAVGELLYRAMELAADLQVASQLRTTACALEEREWG